MDDNKYKRVRNFTLAEVDEAYYGGVIIGAVGMFFVGLIGLAIYGGIVAISS